MADVVRTKNKTQKTYEKWKYLWLLEKVVHELSSFRAHYRRMPIASLLRQEHLHCSPKTLPYRTCHEEREGRQLSFETRSEGENEKNIPYRANAMLYPPVTVCAIKLAGRSDVVALRFSRYSLTSLGVLMTTAVLEAILI